MDNCNINELAFMYNHSHNHIHKPLIPIKDGVLDGYLRLVNTQKHTDDYDVLLLHLIVTAFVSVFSTADV